MSMTFLLAFGERSRASQAKGKRLELLMSTLLAPLLACKGSPRSTRTMDQLSACGDA